MLTFIKETVLFHMLTILLGISLNITYFSRWNKSYKISLHILSKKKRCRLSRGIVTGEVRGLRKSQPQFLHIQTLYSGQEEDGEVRYLANKASGSKEVFLGRTTKILPHAVYCIWNHSPSCSFTSLVGLNKGGRRSICPPGGHLPMSGDIFVVTVWWVVVVLLARVE